MAAIGEVSSVITLVDLAVQLTRETKKLCQDFIDAPRQLQAVSRRTLSIRGLLEELTSARDELSTLETLASPCRDVLSQSLRLAWTTVIEIQRERNRYCNAHKCGARFRWALLGKNTCDRLLQSLRDVELELVLAINLVQCRAEIAVVSSLKKFQSSIDGRLDASKLTIDHPTFRNNSLCPTAPVLTECSPIHLHTSCSSTASNLLQILGIQGCHLSYSCQNGRIRYIILRTPIIWNRIFSIEIGIRTLAAAGSGISIFRQHLSIRNVVAKTSSIMTASSQGDLRTIQRLFENREASPFDITEDGETPLELAIEGGNTRLVSFLLENGADPNTTVDARSGMSVLQYALSDRNSSVARLLLLWGAFRWHIDENGWTNASYIWARRQDDGKRSQECLQLLLTECCPALTSCDAQNWTVLHRAASFGNLEDVQMLLKNGANPRAAVNGWTPVFYAICLKNYPVVPELVKAGFDINYQDGGGWTILHLAARTNSKYALDCLFELGANPHIKGVSQDVYWHNHGKSRLLDTDEYCVTPLDLARSEGEECFKTFVRAAQEAGIDLSLDSDGEAFWPAEKYFEETSA